MIKQAQAIFLMLCLTILVGCGVPVFSSSEAFPEPTHIYETVSAGLTATAVSTAMANVKPIVYTATPNLTNLVSKTPPGIQPTGMAAGPTSPAALCNRATAGKPSIDVTIPDGTQLDPGQPFSKTWRVINSGSCTWTNAYGLVWFSGESLSILRKQNFTSAVPSGQSVDITIDMVAPDQAGIHQSYWKFIAPDGSLFGLGPSGDAPFWVSINVTGSNPPDAEAVATQAPTPAIVIKDTVILLPGQGIDLDVGTIDAGSADDLGFVTGINGVASLMPTNGARMAIIGPQEPTVDDCRVATLSSEGVVLSTIQENSYFCYRTNMGLPGFGKLSNLTNQSLAMYYATWMAQ